MICGSALYFLTALQTQQLHGRFEGGVWILYTVTNAKLYRIVPSLLSAVVIATPPTNMYFLGSAAAPFRADMALPSFSSSTTATPSVTASPSGTRTPSLSSTATRSGTPSITGSGSASVTAGAEPSATATITASPSPLVARFAAGNIVVLRGGAPGGTLVNGQTAPLTLVEMSPFGDVISSIALPTTTDAADSGGTNVRCTFAFSSQGFQLEGFMQRSLDGETMVFPCNDVPIGAALPTNITGRVVSRCALLHAVESTTTSQAAW